MFSYIVKINAKEKYCWAVAHTQKDKEKEKRCKRKHLTYSIGLNHNNSDSDNDEINTNKEEMKKNIRKQENGGQSVWRHTEKFHSWFSLEFLVAAAPAAVVAYWRIKRKRARDQEIMENMYIRICVYMYMFVACI